MYISCWDIQIKRYTLFENSEKPEKKIRQTNVYEGDATDRGNYKGLKLLEHPLKVSERVIEQHIRIVVNINEMQFRFVPEKGSMEVIFIICQLQ